MIDKRQIVLKLKQAMGGIGQSIIITCYTSCVVVGGTIGVGYMSPANMGSAHIIYIGQDLSVTMEIDHLIKDNQIVNSFQNGLMSPAMFAQLTNSLRLKDVTTAASLTSLPVTNYSIKVTLTKTSALSFSQTPNEGQEFMIDVLNSSDTDIVIPMPTATDWQCDDESLEIESGMIRGLSIRS